MPQDFLVYPDQFWEGECLADVNRYLYFQNQLRYGPGDELYIFGQYVRLHRME